MSEQLHEWYIKDVPAKITLEIFNHPTKFRDVKPMKPHSSNLYANAKRRKYSWRLTKTAGYWLVKTENGQKEYYIMAHTENGMRSLVKIPPPLILLQ